MSGTFETKLTCPECSMRMKGAIRFGVEIDACINCYGLWFDEGEMLEYAKQRLVQNLKNNEPPESLVIASGKPKLECPRCRRSASLQPGAAGPYKMSRCSRCSGIYLPFHTQRAIYEPAPRKPRAPRLSEEDPSEVAGGMLAGEVLGELGVGAIFAALAGF